MTNYSVIFKSSKSGVQAPFFLLQLFPTGTVNTSMEQSIKEIEKWIRDVRYKTEDSPLSDYDLRKYGDLAQIIDGYQGKIISLTYELEDLIAARKTGTQLQHQNP